MNEEQLKSLEEICKVLAAIAITNVVTTMVLDALSPNKNPDYVYIRTPNQMMYYRNPQEFIMVKRR